MKNANRATTVQKPCKWRTKRKSHEESCDSSWDFGALEGTRIPGPLIKSQMLYRLSYERIFRSKTILPNNITTIDCKKQEQRRKKAEIPAQAPGFAAGEIFRRTAFGGSRCAPPMTGCCCAAFAAGSALPQNRRAEHTRRRTLPSGRKSSAERQCPAIIFKVR